MMQNLQREFEERQRKQVEIWDRANEREIYRAYPPMAWYYASVGPFWTGLMCFLVVAMVALLLYIFGYSVYTDGWATTMEDLKAGLEACRWYHVAGFILYVLFMGSLFLISPILTKYMEHTETIFTTKCVYVHRFLRKEKIVTYEEMAKLIKRRKIRIKNGRYLIPCKGRDVSVSMITGEFPYDLFSLLEKKCDIQLPNQDFKERARRSGVGWACGHLGGGILFIFTMFISLFIFLIEGEFTWTKLFHDFFANPILWFTMALVGLGLIFNMIFLPSAAWVYREWYQVIRVSVVSIWVDCLIIGLTLGANFYLGNMVEKHQLQEQIQAKIEVRQEIEQRFIRSFCKDVWGKDFEDITAEEFAEIKYIAIDYGGTTCVSYSKVDYKDCESQQEFEETIQTWQCGPDEIFPTPADISMLTGLTYVEVPEYNNLNQSILPKRNQITRIKMQDSPKALEGVINPDNLEVLSLEYYNEADAFGCLKQYPNLRELEYINISCDAAVDLGELSCVESLESLHLACGDSYVNLDVLQDADNLRSLYIDKATLQQCSFVNKMQGLEELMLCYGADGDLTLVSDLPNLKRLWLLDDVAVEASELQSLSSGIEELKITIDAEESLETIGEFRDQLSVLNLTVKNGADWNYYGIEDWVFDLRILTEMTKLVELQLSFEGYFEVKGAELLFGMENLKSLALGGSWFGAEAIFYIDEAKMEENYSVETLLLSKCILRDTQQGELLSEEFLTQFKGVQNLSLIRFDWGPESYDFLSEYPNLESLTVDRIFLSESQIQELEMWEDKIEVSYR